MDGWSISAAEGFRLAGFNGSPKIFDSVEPLIDILVTTSNDNDVGGVEWSSSSDTVRITFLDSIKEHLETYIAESHRKTAKRLMLN
jgi:hypothetical protein